VTTSEIDDERVIGSALVVADELVQLSAYGK